MHYTLDGYFLFFFLMLYLCGFTREFFQSLKELILHTCFGSFRILMYYRLELESILRHDISSLLFFVYLLIEVARYYVVYKVS